MIESLTDKSGAVPSASRPKAVGLVRTELSGIDTAAHALDIQCYAHHLGYRWIYTVRPPQGTRDPVGYALDIAASMGAAAIIVVDATHIDSPDEFVSAGFDLVTTAPPRLWRAGAGDPIVVQSVPADDCTWEPSQLEPDCARRLWNTHRDCLPDCRARLAAGAALSARDEMD
ncbi:hypothetical protein [Nocardia spumae]|uniref:hypothetical protein n=1 Tax=Nocardia spumae TaxID=2887190 RepID=UPI001D15A6AF|nr:hypothetical protein [Nocardia spumae]